MQDTNKPSWKNRRRFMFTVSGWIMGIISYIIFKEVTTVAANTFTSVGLMTLGSIIGFYVAGATWEDVKRK